MASNLFKRSLFPLKSHYLPDLKSPFHTFVENALEKTRQTLRVFVRNKSELSSDIFRAQHRLPIEFSQKVSKSKLLLYRPGFLNKVTSRWASDSLAASITKEWRRKMLQRGSGPMLCFIGFGLVKKPTLQTQEEEHEGVSYSIRDSFSTIPWEKIGLNIDKNYQMNEQVSIADFQIGTMIAKGCNAAVYSACFEKENSAKLNTEGKDPQVIKEYKTDLLSYSKRVISYLEEEQEKNDAQKGEMLGNEEESNSTIFISHSEGEEDVKPLVNDNLLGVAKKDVTEEKFGSYNLAVKVMFNYSAESNAYAIWNAMQRETLPAIAQISDDEEKWHKYKKKKLKAHPNIVEMYFAFADQIPLLPGAYKNFPQALPVRLLNDGCGRNMTLFLVMKRYHCSLKDYLKQQSPSLRTSLLLFAQLLEALVHLSQNKVAHRDLKTDNVLIDISQGISSPKLAIADFGCCLEGLYLNYPSYEISKGGNMALMAPEIVNAEAGPFAALDYSRSDLWTAGTMAYEIFGTTNPFYSANSKLKNKSYKENSLPCLPIETPAAIKRLVKEMLHIDPKQRPSPNFAATVCQLLLHAPSDLLSGCCNKKISHEALKWMFNLSTETYLESSFQSSALSSLEFELRHTFCSRIQYLEVIEALKYILDS